MSNADAFDAALTEFQALALDEMWQRLPPGAAFAALASRRAWGADDATSLEIVGVFDVAGASVQTTPGARRYAEEPVNALRDATWLEDLSVELDGTWQGSEHIERAVFADFEDSRTAVLLARWPVKRIPPRPQGSAAAVQRRFVAVAVDQAPAPPAPELRLLSSHPTAAAAWVSARRGHAHGEP